MNVFVGYLCVFFGGTVGALARFGVQEAWSKTGWAGWTGVLLINVLGSFLIGLSVSWLQGLESAWSHEGLSPLRLYIQTLDAEHGLSLLAVGFCGAFTTFSTFSLDNIFLFYTNTWRMVVNMLGSVFFALLAVWGGWYLGHWVAG